MDKNNILSIFDQGRRNPGEGWEVTEYVVRQLGRWGDEGTIYHSRFPPEKLDEGIKEQIAYFSAFGQGFEWKVFEHDKPLNLREKLREYGFVVPTPEAFMVLDIDEAPTHLTMNEKVRITRVNKLDALKDYEYVWTTVFGKEMSNSLREKVRMEPEKVSLYVAYIGDEPASVGRIDFDDDQPRFAGFCGGATLPKHRRQGLYTGLVLARIDEVRRRGYRYMYVDALPPSETILIKLGFQKMSVSYPMLWRPES